MQRTSLQIQETIHIENANRKYSDLSHFFFFVIVVVVQFKNLLINPKY